MTSRRLIPFILVFLFCALLVAVPLASADSSHARIVRLSLVQGDVRFASQSHGDPLTDSSAIWSDAELNLPIRQGYVLATDNGRAEVEFENGAMAFLKENTVLEFYDLSLQDGERTTRLVLRQGSASFYVNPSGGEYFSVTGGDFTVEADGRSSFRMDNFDDGSTVETFKGHIAVLRKNNTTHLDKGQSLSIKAGDETSVNIGRLPDEDEFDRWVSGRIDSVTNATNSTLQYTSSPYYAPGFADLSLYGSWASCGAYGYGWRPFGAGIGWSPFAVGQWILDPAFGWTWISSQPWGWAPYHYGGWLFDTSCGGWFYSPPYGYGYGFVPGRRHFPPVVHPPHLIYHPVTGVFVRQGSSLGLVPMHPMDQPGKTPLNLQHGVFLASPARTGGQTVAAAEANAKWQPVKSAPREAFGNSLVATTAPNRVSRTIIMGSSGPRVISISKDSSIAYDPRQHAFVNANASAKESASSKDSSRTGNIVVVGEPAPTVPAAAPVASSRTPVVPAHAGPPPARSFAPPPAAHYSGGSSGGSFGGGGSHFSGGGGGGHTASAGSAGSAGHASGGGGGGHAH
jgi:FecR protein